MAFDATNSPFGLRSVNSNLGGAWTEKTNAYRISASPNGLITNASSIYSGDPVVWQSVAGAGLTNGGGTITVFDTTGTAGNGDSAGTSNATGVLGRFVGCEYIGVDQIPRKQKYWIGGTPVLPGTTITAYVEDDAHTVFEAQVSTYTDVLNDARFTENLVGQNFGFGLGITAGNTTVLNPTSGTADYGSAIYVTTTFTTNNIAHTTSTLPFKVIGYSLNASQLSFARSYVADGTANGTAAYLTVRGVINNHIFKAGTTAIVAA